MYPLIILFSIEEFHGFVAKVEDKTHVEGCDEDNEKDEDPSQIILPDVISNIGREKDHPVGHNCNEPLVYHVDLVYQRIFMWAHPGNIHNHKQVQILEKN